MMKIENKTRNQHYVSQAEQKLNSSNRQNIYQFEVHNKDSDLEDIFLKRKDPSRNVEKNLALKHLYTFEKLTSGLFLNLELIFKEYEDEITNSSNKIIAQLQENCLDITDDYVKLYKVKLMNIFRNPFNINFTLECLSPLEFAQFLDSDENEMLNRIGLAEPDQKILNFLEVDIATYRQWLKILFALLVTSEKKESLLDIFLVHQKNNIKSNLIIAVIISDEPNHCLLSDRGFTNFSVDHEFFFSFSLDANHIISFSSHDIADDPNVARMENPDKVISLHHKTKKVYIIRDYPALQHLKSYNQQTAYQSKNHVFCKSEKPYGINIIDE
jgi:hypothetical protein